MPIKEKPLKLAQTKLTEDMGYGSYPLISIDAAPEHVGNHLNLPGRWWGSHCRPGMPRIFIILHSFGVRIRSAFILIHCDSFGIAGEENRLFSIETTNFIEKHKFVGLGKAQPAFAFKVLGSAANEPRLHDDNGLFLHLRDYCTTDAIS